MVEIGTAFRSDIDVVGIEYRTPEKSSDPGHLSHREIVFGGCEEIGDSKEAFFLVEV